MTKFKKLIDWRQKYVDMPDEEWADVLMMWFKDNPEMMVNDEAQEFYDWAQENCSKHHRIERDRDVELIRFELDEFQNFRDRVFKSLNSEKMALPDWLLDLNELLVHVNYTTLVDKKLVAIKAFEARMSQEFERYRANPNGIRF